MKSFLIANPKGGAGKSTLATNLAGYFAHRGYCAMLGDIDNQHSTRDWLTIRPPTLPPILDWHPGKAFVGKKGYPAPASESTTRAVLDTPADLHGRALENALSQVGHVIVPIQPSLFDILATRQFLETLLSMERVRRGRLRVAIVGMRVDARTRAAGELTRFLSVYGLPPLTYLRDTQLYIQAAANGMTLFDLPPARIAKDLEQWQPLVSWVEG